jgi:hypothetical protein
MDGFIPLETGRRRTLKAAIGCVGIGLHSGRRVRLSLQPAAPGTGIRFRRTDTGADPFGLGSEEPLGERGWRGGIGSRHGGRGVP